ncbi:MAG: tRNA pseudouridine(54/55) synthase Pus10 [Candidatus Diapherotrites archaeon]|nr:tRNA pseudouridine(54/55) synthase Pus10 [Candidatus Diapherotrites archaeon]
MNFAEKKSALMGTGACDQCIGRQFSQQYKGTDNAVIGFAVRSAAAEEDIVGFFHDASPELKESCPLCKGAFLRIDEAVGDAVSLLQSYEFDSFLVGARVDNDLMLREEELWSSIGAEGVETLKKDLVRSIGKRVEAKTAKAVDFDHPDITVLVDFTRPKPKVRLEVHSSFVYGEYQKLVTGIPQTKWFCRACRGRGCERCKFTGKMYETSVEEIVSAKLVEASGARSESFHGSGREDIDAKMLGWRPFVVELEQPVKRFFDFEALTAEVNDFAAGRVRVRALRRSDKQEVRLLKSVKYDKTYRAFVECENDVDEPALRRIEAEFSGVSLNQRTPQRVAHRRADKVRKRVVRSVKCELADSKHFSAVVTAESGTYIKELVSGDEGRTKPSFADFVGPCRCVDLDVLEVHKHD